MEKYKALSTELGKKRSNLEAQLADAQGRLKEASSKASDLAAVNTKLQVHKSTICCMLTLLGCVLLVTQ